MPNNPATRKAGALRQVPAANQLVRRGPQAVAVASATSSLKENIASSVSDESASTPPSDGFPIGGIIMWAGLLADVPAGWNLCDGTAGTPDLREIFIMGWTDAVDPGGTGGAINHSHAVGTLANSSTSGGTPAGSNASVSGGTPAGTVNLGPTSADVAAGAGTSVLTAISGSFTGSALAGHTHTFTGSALASHTHTISGSTANADGRPPYYQLAFLRKAA